VTLLIPFSGFVWNQVQERELERQKVLERERADAQARIENARGESDIVIKLLPALSSTDDSSAVRGIALAVLLNLGNRQALSPELVSSIQVAVDTAQQRIREGKATEAERVALNKLAAAADRPPEQTNISRPAGAEVPTAARAFRVQIPRVYIQIFDEADRERARALQDWCTTTQRWLAPGIENVVATAKRNNRNVPEGTNTWRVLYFNDEDFTRANDLAGRLRTLGAGVVVVQRRTQPVPVGQLEVWAPRRSG
jgi:hypothetical protein